MARRPDLSRIREIFDAHTPEQRKRMGENTVKYAAWAMMLGRLRIAHLCFSSSTKTRFSALEEPACPDPNFAGASCKRIQYAAVDRPHLHRTVQQPTVKAACLTGA